MLKINTNKTKIIFVLFNDSIKLTCELYIHVRGANITPSNCARNLGAWLDFRDEHEKAC